MGIQLNKAELHIVGLVSIFIASKQEDVIPIQINQILIDAAHGKYEHSQILETELDILQTLGFKIHTDTFYDVACSYLKSFILECKNINFDIPQYDQDELFRHCGFLCQLVMHSIEITALQD